jgi:hypothetical protein
MTFDISSFCSTDKMHPYICKPFNHGEFSIATNGHILVRVPVQEAYAGNDGPQNIGDAIRGMDDPLVFIPLPPLNFETETCKACGGQRYTVECSTCNGEGEQECCTCGHAEECDDCHGKGHYACAEGTEPCEACKSKGVLPLERYALLDPTSCYDIIYLQMIQALPGIMIAPCGDTVPMVFKFDGGMGLLMPVNLSVKAVKLYAEEAA